MKIIKKICFGLFTIQSIALSAQGIGAKLPAGTLPNTTLDINGAASLREGTVLTLINGANNDINLATEYSFYRITGPTAAFSITGFDNGQDGRILTVVNATTQTMTLSGATGSVAVNQLLTGGLTFSVSANGSATFQYNTTLTKWVLTGTTGSSTTSNDWSLTGNSGTTAGTNFIGTTDAQAFVFKTNNIEGMRILSGGNIGIGTSTPTGKFELAGLSGSDFVHTRYTTAFGVGANLNLRRSYSSTIGTNVALPDGELIGRINFYGNTGDNTTPYNANTSADIRVFQKGAASLTNNGSELVFATTPQNAIQQIERMRISNTGNIGISSGTPLYRLDVNAYSGSSGDPIRLLGLNAGATSDSILTAASGVVRRMAINSLAWGLTGNSGTTAGTNFVGTTDAQAFVFKTNNTERMRMLSGGNVGIGTTAATNTLHVFAASNPVRLEGLQTGASTDNMLTADATGVVRQVSAPTFVDIADLKGTAAITTGTLSATSSSAALGTATATIYTKTFTLTRTSLVLIDAIIDGDRIRSTSNAVISDGATRMFKTWWEVALSTEKYGANTTAYTNAVLDNPTLWGTWCNNSNCHLVLAAGTYTLNLNVLIACPAFRNVRVDYGNNSNDRISIKAIQLQ